MTESVNLLHLAIRAGYISRNIVDLRFRAQILGCRVQERASWFPVDVGMTATSGFLILASAVTGGRGFSGCAAATVFATCAFNVLNTLNIFFFCLIYRGSTSCRACGPNQDCTGGLHPPSCIFLVYMGCMNMEEP